MGESEQAIRRAEWLARRFPDSAVRLGDTVSELMDKQITPRQISFKLVTDLWTQLLPAELCRHCKVMRITAGQLKVLVDSPVYMYELQLCSSEVLAELQRRCPQARLKAIKLTVGPIASGVCTDYGGTLQKL